MIDRPAADGPAVNGPVTAGPMIDGPLDVIAFGTVFLELVFGHVPRLPEPGEEIYGDEFAISVGGGAITVATAATALGLRSGVSALLGDDLGSRVAQEHCRRCGIVLTPSAYVTGRAAGITVVLNFHGDRAFISYVPPRPARERPHHSRWAEILRTHRPAWCYLHAGPRAVAAVREARSLGVQVALDVARSDIEDDPEAVVSCARMADVFLPNSDELLRLTGAGSLADALDVADAWETCVVVKRGAAGATVAGRLGRVDVADGVRPARVRDLTGAGDAFAGGLIGALHHGAPITEAVAAGNAAGSQTVSKLGAVGEVEVAGLSEAAPALAAALLGGAATERGEGSR